MLRPSEGSAPVDFVVVVGPSLLAFSLLIQVCLASFESAQLTFLAYRLAEVSALADSTEEVVEELFNIETAARPELSISLEQFELGGSELKMVRLALPGPFGLQLNAEGVAIAELQK